MKTTTKTDWQERFDCEKPLQIKIIEKRFADIPAGASMLIVLPKMVDSVVRSIPKGKTLQQSDVRAILAKQYKADYACPVTTGIALRVVSELAYAKWTESANGSDISPFWRAVDPDSALAAKLTCGKDFLIKKRLEEGI